MRDIVDFKNSYLKNCLRATEIEINVYYFSDPRVKFEAQMRFDFHHIDNGNRIDNISVVIQ